MKRVRRLLLLLILAATIATAYTGTFGFYEGNTTEILNITLMSGTSEFGSSLKYCFRQVAYLGGWNYYAGNNKLEIMSPPSPEVCANDYTNATHQQFYVCWNVSATNFTDATTVNGDAYMHGFYYTTSPGNYSVYGSGNVVYDGNFRYYYHLARKPDLDYQGGTAYCALLAPTRLYYNLPLYEDGLPFLDIAGGSSVDPITPHDVYDFLEEINRTEHIDRLDAFEGADIGAGYSFKFSFGGYSSYNNASVFNVPANVFLYQPMAAMKMNTLQEFTMGELNYNANEDQEYLPALGGIYSRMGLYPWYDTLYGPTGIYGSMVTAGITTEVSNLRLTDHGIQWASTTNQNLTQSLFQGAGRLNSLNIIDSIIISLVTPSMMQNRDYANAGFNAYEVNAYDLGRGQPIESTVYGVDLSKMSTRLTNYDSSTAYWFRWVASMSYNITRVNRYINTVLPDEWLFRYYLLTAGDAQLVSTEEFDLGLRVVNAETAAPIENATLTITDSQGNNALYGKSVTALSASSSNYVYAFDETYFAVEEPSQFEVGDYLKAGAEVMKVTGVNATGVNVTRGEFNTTPWGLIYLSGTTNNGSVAAYGTKVFRAWDYQLADANGDFELIRLVNRTMRFVPGENGASAATYYKECENNHLYAFCMNMSNFTRHAPFTITINASGYNNFTTYYTPTQENYFTIGLANTTECPDCPATVSMTGNAANGGVVVVKREVALPSAAPVQQGSGFGEGLLLGGAVVGFVVLLGLFARGKRD